MSRRLIATALAADGLAAAAGCGDDHTVQGIDTDDPKAVARAITEAQYRCGEDGAGLIYDLLTPPPRFTRDELIDDQHNRGCRPRRVPEVAVVAGPRQGDALRVEVRVPSDPGRSGELRLIRKEEGWRVDSGRGLP